MPHLRASRATSIRRFAGASALGMVIGAGALAAAPVAGAEPVDAPGPVIIGFYDFPSVGDGTPDSAFFQWPQGYGGGALRGRLLSSSGALKSPTTEVTPDVSGSVKVEGVVAGDVAELYDPESGTVIGRATYDGKPDITFPTCAGTSTATGARTAGEPLQNVEAITPVPGAESSDVKINPSTLADQPADGSSWTATFAAPLALGDLVNAYSSATRNGVLVQSFVQRSVSACGSTAPAPLPGPTPAPAPAPVAPRDTTAPTGTSTPVKTAKKPKLASLTKDGLAFAVTTKENATLKATLTLRTTSGKGKKKTVKDVVIGSVTQPATAGAATTVHLKADKSAAAKLKKAAKQAGSKLVVTITLTDAAGNVTTLPATTTSLPKV